MGCYRVVYWGGMESHMVGWGCVVGWDGESYCGMGLCSGVG